VPRVGLTFDSEGAAYNFCNSYARRIGFSIRKCHVKHRASDGTLASKYMVCSNEGLKNCKQTHLIKKERASTRSECKARVQQGQNAMASLTRRSECNGITYTSMTRCTASIIASSHLWRPATPTVYK
jgi:hypothetical protein